MANKFVVIINSLKVLKIKKILLYEKKFLVPNYSCLQNPWLVGATAPRSPFSLSSVLHWICWTPPRTKFLGTPLDGTVWPVEWKRSTKTDIKEETNIALSWWNYMLFLSLPVSQFLHANKDVHLTSGHDRLSLVTRLPIHTLCDTNK